MRLCRLAAALLAVAYPALVYYGLTRFEPRVLGLLLLAILLLRQGSRTLAFWRSAPRASSSPACGNSPAARWSRARRQRKP